MHEVFHTTDAGRLREIVAALDAKRVTGAIEAPAAPQTSRPGVGGEGRGVST